MQRQSNSEYTDVHLFTISPPVWGTANKTRKATGSTWQSKQLRSQQKTTKKHKPWRFSNLRIQFSQQLRYGFSKVLRRSLIVGVIRPLSVVNPYKNTTKGVTNRRRMETRQIEHEPKKGNHRRSDRQNEKGRRWGRLMVQEEAQQNL